LLLAICNHIMYHRDNLTAQRGNLDRMNRLANLLKSAYNNLNIKHKFFTLITLIMGFSFLVTYSSLQYAYSIYDTQLYTKSSQLLNLSSTSIENELKKLERLSYTIDTDLQIQDLLLSLNENMTEFEKSRIRSYITDRLVQYAGNEQYIYSVVVTDMLDGESVAGQFSRPLSPKKKTMILKESAAGMGAVHWIIPDEEDPYLFAVREIRSYQKFELEKIGTLSLRIYIDKIAENVLAGTELKNGFMQIAAGNRMIYPLEKGKINAIADYLISDSQNQGYMIEQLNGQQYFITHVESGYLGWTYHSLIPFDQIFKKIIIMKNILLVGFIVSLLVALGLALKFARSITRPIENLIGRMRQVQRGDFSLSKAETSEGASLQMDEFGQLQRTFRMMIEQINHLITENYSKQITIKETQFKALQAQINPHFLYNTLESINWMAKANGQPQISKMVESLGFLFRQSISLKEVLITVGEELDIVTNYITIQKFRFEERLIFEMDVPLEVRELLLPKFTLQPLLENSIHYALETMVEPCLIRISARREPGKCILVVEDNGPGMDGQLLEKVRKGEARTRGSGIGLKNIEERIIIAFGESYGIYIQSGAGQGTRISVIIPDETRDSDV
jgi:two-component system sensor histidine kinase YesM